MGILRFALLPDCATEDSAERGDGLPRPESLVLLASAGIAAANRPLPVAARNFRRSMPPDWRLLFIGVPRLVMIQWQIAAALYDALWPRAQRLFRCGKRV